MICGLFCHRDQRPHKGLCGQPRLEAATTELCVRDPFRPVWAGGLYYPTVLYVMQKHCFHASGLL